MATRFAQSPAFASALYSAYNPGEMVDTGLKGRSIQSQQAATADADVANAIRMGKAQVKGAKAMGAATVAQGQAAGHSSMMGGLSSGLGSIVGGLGSMGNSNPGGYAGSVNSPGFGMDASKQVGIGSYGGSVGGYGTFGPNWGFPSP